MIIKLILTACSRVSSDKCYSCTDEDLSSATILEQCNDPNTAENCNFVNSHVSMHPFKCSLAMYPDSSKYVTLYQTESMRRRLLKWVEILCASGIKVVKFLGFGPLAHFWLLGRCATRVLHPAKKSASKICDMIAASCWKQRLFLQPIERARRATNLLT